SRTGSHLGLLRRLEYGPRGLFRIRRLLHGHVSVTPDREGKCLWKRAAGLHGLDAGQRASPLLVSVQKLLGWVLGRHARSSDICDYIRVSGVSQQDQGCVLCHHYASIGLRGLAHLQSERDAARWNQWI